MNDHLAFMLFVVEIEKHATRIRLLLLIIDLPAEIFYTTVISNTPNEWDWICFSQKMFPPYKKMKCHDIKFCSDIKSAVCSVCFTLYCFQEEKKNRIRPFLPYLDFH